MARQTLGLTINDFEYAIFDRDSDTTVDDNSLSDFTRFTQAVRWQNAYTAEGRDTLIVARRLR